MFYYEISIRANICIPEVYGSVNIGTNNDVNERKVEGVKGWKQKKKNNEITKTFYIYSCVRYKE